LIHHFRHLLSQRFEDRRKNVLFVVEVRVKLPTELSDAATIMVRWWSDSHDAEKTGCGVQNRSTPGILAALLRGFAVGHFLLYNLLTERMTCHSILVKEEKLMTKARLSHSTFQVAPVSTSYPAARNLLAKLRIALILPIRFL